MSELQYWVSIKFDNIRKPYDSSANEITKELPRCFGKSLDGVGIYIPELIRDFEENFDIKNIDVSESPKGFDEEPEEEEIDFSKLPDFFEEATESQATIGVYYSCANNTNSIMSKVTIGKYYEGAEEFRMETIPGSEEKLANITNGILGTNYPPVFFAKETGEYKAAPVDSYDKLLTFVYTNGYLTNAQMLLPQSHVNIPYEQILKNIEDMKYTR